jgi:hypothetical protein
VRRCSRRLNEAALLAPGTPGGSATLRVLRSSTCEGGWAGLTPHAAARHLGARTASQPATSSLFQAENNFDLSPSKALAEAMRVAGKAVEMRIYPAYGNSRGEGHNFAWLGSDIWGPDVLAFLRQHCRG